MHCQKSDDTRDGIPGSSYVRWSYATPSLLCDKCCVKLGGQCIQARAMSQKLASTHIQ
ncbi:hypothetical protein HAX54_037527, partial [Datura stramonium]|nr:hypothetical protein [Datura stramonium]